MRLVALHSVDTKNEYVNLAKDLKINKIKIDKDAEWFKEKVESLGLKDPNIKNQMIQRSAFKVYGNSVIAH